MSIKNDWIRIIFSMEINYEKEKSDEDAICYQFW